MKQTRKSVMSVGNRLVVNSVTNVIMSTVVRYEPCSCCYELCHLLVMNLVVVVMNPVWLLIMNTVPHYEPLHQEIKKSIKN